MSEVREWKRADWALLLAAVAWLGATAWVRSLMLPDEGRYVGVAWEMLRSGDWVTPTLDGLPYFHKPPMFYWITAASMSVFGMNEWAARLAPLLGGALAAASIYAFALRHADRGVARLSLLVFATQPLVFVSSQYANHDMLVAGFISATIVLAAHAALGEASRRNIPLVCAYAFAALGILSKGLIGAVLPGAVIVAWAFALRRPRLLLQLVSIPGIVVFFAIASPWIVANEMRFPGFAHYFIVVQHFSRFAQTGFNNAQPVWFFPVVLMLAALPWSLWIVSAARRRYWGDESRKPVRLLMWTWLIVITAFFSIPHSKLVGYILPVAAPLAFLVADAALQGFRERGVALRGVKVAAAFAAAACLAVIVATQVKPPRSFRDLGIALRSAGPKDGVVFLQEYAFDLSFYARLRQTVSVVDVWDDPKLLQGDTWRRELADAGEFAPEKAKELRVFVTPAKLGELVCSHDVTWIFGHREMPASYAILKKAERVAAQGEGVLWRVRSAAAACAPGAIATTTGGAG